MANDIAVFPVPGGPANSNALPAIFFALINSTTIPPAFINILITYLAIYCPTIP